MNDVISTAAVTILVSVTEYCRSAKKKKTGVITSITQYEMMSKWFKLLLAVTQQCRNEPTSVIMIITQFE